MLHPCDPAQCAGSVRSLSVSRAIIGVLFPSGSYTWGCYIHVTLLSKDPLSDDSRQLNWEFAIKGGLVSKTLIFVIVFNLVFHTAIATLGKLSFFQNEEIFVSLDELDELDRIIYAWIGFNYNSGSSPWYFVNFTLLNSSN